MHRFFLIIAILISGFARAQVKPTYTAILEGGFLHGQNGNSNTISFSNGVMYKNAMIGLGVATDNYYYRSIPVFGEIRKSFGRRRIRPFVSGSAGINLPHLTSEEKQQFEWYHTSRIKNGFIAKTSAGASFRFSKHFRLFGSIGYNYKTTKIIYNSQVYYPQQPTSFTSNSYRMNRLCLSIGLWY